MEQKTNQLRIIAGRYRGRKIRFPDIAGLRPTPDRVRETLFNWLQSHIISANCLDVFAGSGALGLEALSRGANHVIFVEQNKTASNYLRTITNELFPNNSRVLHKSFPCDLNLAQHSVDIVFLDPPFRKGYPELCLDWLNQSQTLKNNALVYLETEKELQLTLNSCWQVLKEKTAGQVCYRLLKLHVDPLRT